MSRDLLHDVRKIEPQAMLLDLAMFSEPAKTAPANPSTSQPAAGTPASAAARPTIRSLPPIRRQLTPPPPGALPAARPDRLPQKPPPPRTEEKAEKKEAEIPPSQPTRSSPASAARHRFIQDHLSDILRISQRTLLRLGVPRIRTRHRRVKATASFRLHPDGSISDLHLSRSSGIRAIDRRTLRVIRSAHRRYPRPTVPVQVVITMQYRL